MIPLTFANVGEDLIIKRVGGKPEVKKHLEKLGFVVGSNVKVINMLAGDVIVVVRKARIAISNEMAQKIMV
ncbi:MAG: FeoA family protein [Oscillospiraceae bacterium]